MLVFVHRRVAVHNETVVLVRAEHLLTMNEEMHMGRETYMYLKYFDPLERLPDRIDRMCPRRWAFDMAVNGT